MRFAAEMRATFHEALMERRVAAPFTIAECGSVVLNAGREWLCKLTTEASTRGRRLPDCRMMRPAGVTRREWSVGLDSIQDDDGDAGIEPTEH
jgi:hypothetical protein